MSDKKYQNPSSAPLLDHVINKLKLKNDAALARTLEVKPPIICKLRSGALPATASTILLFHDKCGMSIKEIRALLPQPTA